MTPFEYYQDFLAIRNMNSPLSKKIRMLTELLGGYEDCWRVIGITEQAVEIFSLHDYRKISRMGINRAHIIDRNKSYTLMLTGPLLDAENWWEYYLEHDKTILATSSENLSKKLSKVYDIDPALGLFKTKGFAWSHGTLERKYLQELHKIIG